MTVSSPPAAANFRDFILYLYIGNRHTILPKGQTGTLVSRKKLSLKVVFSQKKVFTSDFTSFVPTKVVFSKKKEVFTSNLSWLFGEPAGTKH